MIRRVISFFILTLFFISSMGPASYVNAAPLLGLPEPGVMMSLSMAFNPTLIKGVTLDVKNPFNFNFIVDQGDVDTIDPDFLKSESTKLIKYFLAALTIPEKDVWVNLSPYEKDRTLPKNLSQTQMGRDMLAQDYILKQITASLIYPEKELGKEFWSKVYAKAQQLYGQVDIPINTFNKVWITADKAEVYERGQSAFIINTHLKVMLEEDYLATTKNQSQPGDMFQKEQQNVSSSTLPSETASTMKAPQVNPHSRNVSTSSLSSQIIKEIIIPELEKEVNTGKNFAPLRQMFHSMVLASWFKLALKDALIAQLYSNQSKTKGLEALASKEEPVGLLKSELPMKKNVSQEKAPNDVQAIYERYIQAYKKGVFNYIKEEENHENLTALSSTKNSARNSQQPNSARKYFSGGLHVIPNLAMITRRQDAQSAQNFALSVAQQKIFNVNAAMTAHIDIGLDSKVNIELDETRKVFSNLQQGMKQRAFKIFQDTPTTDAIAISIPITDTTLLESGILQQILNTELLNGQKTLFVDNYEYTLHFPPTHDQIILQSSFTAINKGNTEISDDHKVILLIAFDRIKEWVDAEQLTLSSLIHVSKIKFPSFKHFSTNRLARLDSYAMIAKDLEHIKKLLVRTDRKPGNFMRWFERQDIAFETYSKDELQIAFSDADIRIDNLGKPLKGISGLNKGFGFMIPTDSDGDVFVYFDQAMTSAPVSFDDQKIHRTIDLIEGYTLENKNMMVQFLKGEISPLLALNKVKSLLNEGSDESNEKAAKKVLDALWLGVKFDLNQEQIYFLRSGGYNKGKLLVSSQIPQKDQIWKELRIDEIAGVLSDRWKLLVEERDLLSQSFSPSSSAWIKKAERLIIIERELNLIDFRLSPPPHKEENLPPLKFPVRSQDVYTKLADFARSMSLDIKNGELFEIVKTGGDLNTIMSQLKFNENISDESKKARFLSLWFIALQVSKSNALGFDKTLRNSRQIAELIYLFINEYQSDKPLSAEAFANERIKNLFPNILKDISLDHLVSILNWASDAINGYFYVLDHRLTTSQHIPSIKTIGPNKPLSSYLDGNIPFRFLKDPKNKKIKGKWFENAWILSWAWLREEYNISIPILNDFKVIEFLESTTLGRMLPDGTFNEMTSKEKEPLIYQAHVLAAQWELIEQVTMKLRRIGELEAIPVLQDQDVKEIRSLMRENSALRHKIHNLASFMSLDFAMTPAIRKNDEWREDKEKLKREKNNRNLLHKGQKRATDIDFTNYATSIEQSSATGGIDLNAQNMGLSISKDAFGGVQVSFDPAMVERMKRDGFEGLMPVIINITPVLDIRPMLGLAPRKEEEEKLAGV